MLPHRENSCQKAIPDSFFETFMPIQNFTEGKEHEELTRREKSTEHHPEPKSKRAEVSVSDYDLDEEGEVKLKENLYEGEYNHNGSSENSVKVEVLPDLSQLASEATILDYCIWSEDTEPLIMTTPPKVTRTWKNTRNHAHSIGNKRSRRDADSDSSTDDGGISVCSSHKRLKKPSFQVKSNEIKAFLRLLEDPVVNEFLMMDSCMRISDKYLISMVFAYFKRAGFSTKEFTRMNFFIALYLANDMEEDEEEYKYDIFPWALGRKWRERYPKFLHKRDKLWQRIDFRAVVSRKCCEEVMAIEPDHYCWKRDRPEHHSGAIRSYMKDQDDCLSPKGPDASPRYCLLCEKTLQYDSASPGSTTWYLSSCSDSSPEVYGIYKKTVHVVPGSSRFDMEGLRQTLQEDALIWARTKEE